MSPNWCCSSIFMYFKSHQKHQPSVAQVSSVWLYILWAYTKVVTSPPLITLGSVFDIIIICAKCQQVDIDTTVSEPGILFPHNVPLRATFRIKRKQDPLCIQWGQSLSVLLYLPNSKIEQTEKKYQLYAGWYTKLAQWLRIFKLLNLLQIEKSCLTDVFFSLFIDTIYDEDEVLLALAEQVSFANLDMISYSNIHVYFHTNLCICYRSKLNSFFS